ncbi:MAG: SGNH/GDSL hydrolase family protein [Clostridiales bacterium]|nr:SGNH/GDSL hydrolase family protein [Clostridiales bacterium]
MKRLGARLLVVAVSLLILWAAQRLLEPKYMGRVVEGAFIGEYYQEHTAHDVIFLGDCEVYENISPVVLWREYGITSYIRGSAQQLIAQSYYLLEDVLREEVPDVVVFNVSAMQQYDQENESYNRMTLDGMRWSPAKWKAIEETRVSDEHMVEYVFPILRYHSRWQELEDDDFTYFWNRRQVSHNGYYMRADVRPAGDFPTARRRADYSFDERAWGYLEKMRSLCEKNGITMILMKAPSLYPVWYDEWDRQIADYADEHGLAYINCIQAVDEIGIDFSQDTYDGGMHMNVYGAEKMSRYLGPMLQNVYGVKDRREDPELAAVWEEKCSYYDVCKAEQENEFAETGYLSQFSEE